MQLSLHRSGELADWHMIDSQNWNMWQKIANYSKGIITPANLVTLTGGVITVFGLYKLSNALSRPEVSFDLVLMAAGWITLGRLADIIDGVIADKTGTKSPLGETLDASMDKFLLLIALILFALGQLIPIVVLSAVLIEGITIFAITAVGKYHGITIHPIRSGKLATMFIWLLIIIYPFSVIADGTPKLILLIISSAIFAAFVILGSLATVNYYRQYKASRRVISG